jgi:4-hydroxy-tetrahydrodipicolinate reductase
MGNNPLRIGLMGANGRLGRSIAALALKDPSVQITATVTRTSQTPPFPCDLWIDVSSPSALPQNIKIALSTQKPIVIGTTGLSPSDFDLIDNAAQQIPIFYSPNFSLGMALLDRLAEELARKFHSSARIDLVETHSHLKKDAPSGSALMLAKTIEEVRNEPIQIRSIRSEQTTFEHSLSFDAFEERLTLSHQAYNRDVFARGALLAALYLKNQPPGLYTMRHLLD